MSEVDTRRPHEIMLARLDTRIQMDKINGGNAFEIAANVGDKIASAQTVQDVLDAAEGGPGDIADMVGRNFRFIGGTLNWYPSAERYREGGTGKYAVVSCRDAKGNEYTFSTGANNVVFQLGRLEELGVFASAGELSEDEFTIRGKETANGTLYRISAP